MLFSTCDLIGASIARTRHLFYATESAARMQSHISDRPSFRHKTVHLRIDEHSVRTLNRQSNHPAVRHIKTSFIVFFRAKQCIKSDTKALKQRVSATNIDQLTFLLRQNNMRSNITAS